MRLDQGIAPRLRALHDKPKRLSRGKPRGAIRPAVARFPSPFSKVGLGAVRPCRILPTQAILGIEVLECVRTFTTSIDFSAVETAFAAGHLWQLILAKDQDLAILTNDSNCISCHRRTQIIALDVSPFTLRTCLPVRFAQHPRLLAQRSHSRLMGRDQELPARAWRSKYSTI